MTVETYSDESRAYQRDDGVWVFPREEFASTRFDYKPGEHAVFAGPTQRGKTTLAFKLLEYCASSELPAYVVVSKPRDPVSEREGKRLEYRRVAEWPTISRLSETWKGKPNGYLIWPKFGDMDTDVENAQRVTSAFLRDRYSAGVRNEKGILVLDDTMVKSKILGLDTEMTTHIAMAGAMGVGGWYFVQKPSDSGRAALWSYGNSEHLFIFRDPEKRNRQRYDEIGGVDPHMVEHISLTLTPYQALYLKRTGGHMCIVDSK